MKICIDCNYNYLGPDKPIISETTIKRLSLRINEKVIAFQDNEQWIGIICYDKTCPESMQWYIHLFSDSESSIIFDVAPWALFGNNDDDWGTLINIFTD